MSFSIDPRAQALIFDVDGTLLDTMEVHYQAWRETMADYHIDFSKELFEYLGGKISPDIVLALEKEFDRQLPSDQICLAKDQAFVRHAALIQPIHPVLELAERYAGVMPLGAATNEHFGVSNIVMRTTGLTPLFQVLVTADEVERPKPAPDVFLECARRLGVSPERCQVFEDSRYGLEAARSAGMIATDVREVLG